MGPFVRSADQDRRFSQATMSTGDPKHFGRLQCMDPDRPTRILILRRVPAESVAKPKFDHLSWIFVSYLFLVQTARQIAGDPVWRSG